MYLAELCCDSKDEVLVNGRSWSRSCLLAVGVVGVAGTFSLLLACVIPRADSRTIIFAVRQVHRYKFGNVPAVMAGDCGDEIPSKSKPQSAGVTSRANPANLLVFRCQILPHTVNFSFCLSRISRIFSKLVFCDGFLKLLLIFRRGTTCLRQS